MVSTSDYAHLTNMEDLVDRIRQSTRDVTRERDDAMEALRVEEDEFLLLREAVRQESVYKRQWQELKEASTVLKQRLHSSERIRRRQKELIRELQSVNGGIALASSGGPHMPLPPALGIPIGCSHHHPGKGEGCVQDVNGNRVDTPLIFRPPLPPTRELDRGCEAGGKARVARSRRPPVRRSPATCSPACATRRGCGGRGEQGGDLDKDHGPDRACDGAGVRARRDRRRGPVQRLSSPPLQAGRGQKGLKEPKSRGTCVGGRGGSPIIGARPLRGRGEGGVALVAGDGCKRGEDMPRFCAPTARAMNGTPLGWGGEGKG
ncbi:unnamed protein product [Discosporangium mesarthrocarpum]